MEDSVKEMYHAHLHTLKKVPIWSIFGKIFSGWILYLSEFADAKTANFNYQPYVSFTVLPKASGVCFRLTFGIIE